LKGKRNENRPEGCFYSVRPKEAGDGKIRNFRKEHGILIVTKDENFERPSLLFGHPQERIWLRLGNCGAPDIGSW
jgi:predicted nuclease of predicted toxin-antitoxin system